MWHLSDLQFADQNFFAVCEFVICNFILQILALNALIIICAEQIFSQIKHAAEY
jgi:hypothetical protein